MTDLISRSDDYLSHRRSLAYLAVAVLTACGLAYAIGPVLSSPNGHLYSFGGDALVLYYNAVYHVWYGAEGHVLDAMLYPEGELIYMTDAQGVLTVALQWLSRHVVDLRDYIVGVIHAVNIAAVLFAAPATYAVAARLGIHRALALLLVPSIVLLSPPLLRIGGHFGLAYPFVIPLAIHWLLREQRARWRSIRLPDLHDVIVCVALAFLTLNNPYVGASAGLTLLLACGLLASVRPARRADAAVVAALTLAALGFAFACLRLGDFHHDRIGLQWGALSYRTHWSASLVPPGSLLARWLGIESTRDPEVYQYLGVVPVAALLIYALVWCLARFGRSPRAPRLSKRTPRLPTAWRCYMAAASLIYLLCYDWPLSPEFSRQVEEQAEVLLMFKAVSRLAWPFYFVVGLTGLLALDDLLRALSRHGAWAAALAGFSAVSLSIADVGVYHRDRFPIPYANYLSQDSSKVFRKSLLALDPDVGDVQAILSVPRLVAWHDNVMVDWDWNVQAATTRASLALGRPMINATLSRAPTVPLLEVTQLAAHPLLPRGPLLGRLDPDSDLLIAKSEDNDGLPAGEQWLLSIADSLGRVEKTSYFRLSPKRLRSAQLAYRKAAVARSDSSFLPALYFEGYEEASAPRSGGATSPPRAATYAARGYCSRGASRRAPGHHLLAEVIVPDSLRAPTVEVSAWVRVNWRRYGSGSLVVETFSHTGEAMGRQEVEARRSPDVHGAWRRVGATVPVVPGARIRLTLGSVRDELIDNISVQWTGHPARTGETGQFLGNYCVRPGARHPPGPDVDAR